MWAWLTSVSWYNALLKVCTPVVIILSVFYFFFCVIPFLHKMMVGTFEASFIHSYNLFNAPMSDSFPNIDQRAVPSYSSLALSLKCDVLFLWIR